VLADHAQSPGPAVVNMSLSGDASSALDSAVINMVSAGITTVVAAGNGNSDACRVSPARVNRAITVGASNETDQRASFSNYGSCVDLFAPGTNILSTSHSSSTATAMRSGTSQAAPLVAGVAALWLQVYPSALPATVSQTIASHSTLDILGAVGDGSPNRLLFSLNGSLDETAADGQLLADPSFEFGTTYWASDICSLNNPTGCLPNVEFFDSYGASSYAPRSGKNRATIGGPARTFDLSSETVTIPAGVRKAELSVYLWIVTKNVKQSAADILTIEIRDESGGLLETLATYSNLDANDNYTQRRFDVSRYRGANIRVAFRGVQSPGPPTWFMLDDAAVNIWK
ncbi:MAG TPA: S8 family serine peptidase, partial [Gemmatimonadaceae bacterium]|nr:S8 family serine peptidase [Gemmatimonadaceae bacterium]